MTFKWRVKNHESAIHLYQQNQCKMKQQTIKENLVYQRKLKGFTQDQLSEKTTVCVRTIQRIEKGEVQPHLQTVKLLAVGLDIEVEDLIVLDNPNEEKIETQMDAFASFNSFSWFDHSIWKYPFSVISLDS